VTSFFSEPQGAAILKHGILKRYLPVFANKTGSTAGEVVYLDCYAGPGLYDDGSVGSPALALATADALSSYRGRASLHGHLIERKHESVASLRDLLAAKHARWNVHEGRAEDLVPVILAGLDANAPVFAFIDPFGLPIPFEMVVDIMKRGGGWTGGGLRRGAPTEVLMNFSTSGINRVGGQLTATGTDPRWLKARDTMVDRMNRALGGDWWQEVWRRGDDDRVARIRSEYARRMRKAAGGRWATFDIDVADEWQGPAAYHLLLFTQHEDGVWAFHEALSCAQEEYRDYCHRTQGMLDFEPLVDREAKWVNHIEHNIAEILKKNTEFQPVYRLQQVFGDAFGEARQKHLRKALKNLHRSGVISTDSKGELGEKVIRR
jgi:three-Cys-motif partner protein